MTTFEISVLVLLALIVIILLFIYNSGKGGFIKGYRNGYHDAIGACIDQVKKMVTNYQSQQKDAK